MNYVKSFDLFGVEAQQIPCMTGEGAPTTLTEGAVGCLYMDTLNGKVYKCTKAENGVYTWVDELSEACSYGGAASCFNYSLIPSKGTKKGEIRTIIAVDNNGGLDWNFSTSDYVHIPIESVLDGVYFAMPRTEYDDALFATLGANAGCLIGIGLKTDTTQGYDQPIAIAGDNPFSSIYTDDNYTEFVINSSTATINNSTGQEFTDIDWSLYEIKYLEWSMKYEVGQGVIWGGNCWLSI